MIHDESPEASLHGVVATERAEWADGGHLLRRAPEGVGRRLNADARDRMRHPSGCELRVVPEGDGTVEVTLSAAAPTTIRPFWGPFQAEAREIGPEPRRLTFTVPDRVRDLRADVDAGPFDPRVCRLRFGMDAPVAVHDVCGPARPPEPEELPDRRVLFHGTSITEGAAATGPHLVYVARAARAAGVDAVNLGASGSAFCEPAMAEHVVDREWDAATLALSVNMANRGFTVEQFRERVTRFVDTVGETGKPVLCVTLYPYHADLVEGDDPSRARAFRDGLRDAVADAPENVSLLEGPGAMNPTGLTTDLLHPGDAGMADIGAAVASRLEEALR